MLAAPAALMKLLHPPNAVMLTLFPAGRGLGRPQYPGGGRELQAEAPAGPPEVGAGGEDGGYREEPGLLQQRQ